MIPEFLDKQSTRREMLRNCAAFAGGALARDRVQKLKTAGKSAGEIAASKPFADLDATRARAF